MSVEDPVASTALSLEDRMAAQRQSKEEITTDDFPVPGWGSLCWVRLKVIGHKLQRAAVEKNRRTRQRHLLDLYVAADTLIAATDGFYEVLENDTLNEVDTSWIKMAQRVYKCGEVTPRQALIRLIGDERVVPFYGEYLEWLNGERERIGEEQTEDFQATPSP